MSSPASKVNLQPIALTPELCFLNSKIRTKCQKYNIQNIQWSAKTDPDNRETYQSIDKYSRSHALKMVELYLTQYWKLGIIFWASDPNNPHSDNNYTFVVLKDNLEAHFKTLPKEEQLFWTKIIQSPIDETNKVNSRKRKSRQRNRRSNLCNRS